MSVGEGEEDEPDEMSYCEMHNVYHSTWFCAACMDERADRQHDDRLNKQHGMD